MTMYGIVVPAIFAFASAVHVSGKSVTAVAVSYTHLRAHET